MSAPITYDGVPSTEGGNIFKGVKFWVAIRIPQRQRFIDLIKSNGGIIEPLEKNADMLIADGARKDVPPGSYSWTFIEDSVKKGIAMCKDNYSIGPVQWEPVSIRSVKMRNYRVPYSAEDDAKLSRWVRSHKIHRTGKKIYDEFALTNTRHTSSSWQDRWRRTLALFTDEELDEIEAKVFPASNGSSMAHIQPNAATPKASQTEPKEQTPRVQEKENPVLEKASAEIGKEISLVQRQHTVGDVVGEPRPTTPRQHSPSRTSVSQGVESNPDRDNFYNELEAFSVEHGYKIDTSPTIAGIVVDLWELVNIINGIDTQADRFDESDWSYVASELGLDYSDQSQVEELKELWMAFSSGFIAMGEMAGSVDEDTKPQYIEDNTDTRELTPTVADEDSPHHHSVDADENEELKQVLPSDFVLPPSPPMNLHSSPSPPQHNRPPLSHKRRRLDSSPKVPSTPDQYPQPSSTRQITSPSLPPAKRHAQAHISRSSGVEIKDSQDYTQDRLRTPASKRVSPSGHISLPRQEETVEKVYDLPSSPQLNVDDGDPLGDIGRKDADTSEDDDDDYNNKEKHNNSIAIPPKRRLPPSFPQPQRPPPSNKSQDRNQDQNQRRKQKQEQNSSTTTLPTIYEIVSLYTSRGYSRSAIRAAVHATTLTPGKALEIALNAISSGEPLPTHTQGIWTTRDDNSLRLVLKCDGRTKDDAKDAAELTELSKANRELRRITEKHGKDRIEVRKGYLKYMMEND